MYYKVFIITIFLGMGIGDWGLGPIPNPQSPIPNPQLNKKYSNNKYVIIH